MTRHRLLLCASIVTLGSPALADHPAPSAIGGSAGALNVISPETLERGAGAAGFRLAFTQPERRSDAKLVALASQHIHAHGSDYVLNASVGVAYGVSDRLTFSAEIPYVRHDDLRASEHSHAGGVAHDRAVGIGSVAGVGDLSVLAKYRIVDAGATGFALIGGLKLPTGSTHRNVRNGDRLETEHQPGSGSVDAISGAAFGTPVGALQFNASALYQISGKGAQQTRLGNRFQGGIALSHRFEAADDHHQAVAHHDDEGAPAHDHGKAKHGHASWDAFVEITGEWEGRQTIMGEAEAESGGKAVWLSPGARYNAPSGLSAAVAVGVPVWQRIRASHPENDYRLTLSLGHAF